MKIIAVIIIQLLFYLSAFSQDTRLSKYIKAWKTADTSQTHKSTVFFDQLDAEKDTARFRKELAELYSYLDNHPDKRLEARILMYDAFAALVFQFVDPKYAKMLERAMQLAHDLNDDQLMAEIYAYYAELKGGTNHMLYNLKAIDIQKEIGFSHFFTVHNRFFIVSNALYHSKEYRQSINYGLQCLGFVGIDKEHWLRKVYILQLDILGAAYKKLGVCDSAIYYYQKILDTLQSVPDTKYMQTLWTGIAKGNIGHCLGLQKNYVQAIPLIEEYITSSRETENWVNVSIAQNALSDIYYRQRKYDVALASWKEAYSWAVKTNSIENEIEAAKGIAGIYRVSGKTDSSFHYYNAYHEFSDTLEKRLNQNKLSVMQARIASDDLQESLERSQAALNRSKDILRITITGAVLLAIILLLLYNRHRLKEKHKLQLIRQKKDEAEQEAKNAKAQIGQFMNRLVEKNNLIESMEARLLLSEQDLVNRQTMEELSRYTLVSEDEWEKFRAEFAKAYPAFLSALHRLLPAITPAEERLSTLIYLQLNNYQIANTLGIGKDSVSRAKRRLRQRLNLSESTPVEQYIINLLDNKL